MAINFLSVALVARYLGKNNFGILMYAFGFAALFCGFSSCGVDVILPQELAANPSETSRRLGSAWVIKIAGGIVCIALTNFAAFIFEPDPMARFLILMLSVSVLFQSMNVIQFLFEAGVAARYVVWGEIVQALVFVGVRIGLILGGASVQWFGFALLLEPVFMAIALLWLYWRTGHRVSDWSVDREMILGMLRRGLPMALGGAAVLVYLRTDIIMLRHMVGEGAVGVYATAIRLCALSAIPSLQLTRALSPSLVHGLLEGEEVFRKRYQLFVDLLLWVSILISASLALLAPILVPLFFGDDYVSGIPVVRVIAWKGVCAAMGYATGQWILIRKLHDCEPIRNTVGCLINIALNFVLIPRYGIMGAATASVVSFSFAAIFMNGVIPALRPAFLSEVSALTGGVGRLLRFCRQRGRE